MSDIRRPADTAAEVVMMLIYTDLIKNTKENLERIEKVTGLTVVDLQQARNRMAGRSWAPLNVQLLEPLPGSPPVITPANRKGYQREIQPKPAGTRDGPRVRPVRKDDDGNDMLWCTGCDDKEAHWDLAEEFLPRSDRPHLRAHKCNYCRKRYLRARRVSTKVLDQLSTIGMVLQIDKDSNLLGVVCAACGDAFQEGDEIEGTAEVRHVTCDARIGHHEAAKPEGHQQ